MTNDRHGNRAKKLKGSHALNYLTKSEAYSDKIRIRNYCLVIDGIIVQGVLNSI